MKYAFNTKKQCTFKHSWEMEHSKRLSHIIKTWLDCLIVILLYLKCHGFRYVLLRFLSITRIFTGQKQKQPYMYIHSLWFLSLKVDLLTKIYSKLLRTDCGDCYNAATLGPEIFTFVTGTVKICLSKGIHTLPMLYFPVHTHPIQISAVFYFYYKQICLEFPV